MKFRFFVIFILSLATSTALAQSKAAKIVESGLLKEAKQQASIEQELDDCMNRYIARFEIPGAAIAIMRNGKAVYRANFGLSSLEEKRPVNDDTVFSLYSVTKLFVATGVFQLIEDGKLDLDDNVSKHLDGLPEAWHTVKIKHLLTHSSGLPAIAPYADLPEAEARQKVFADVIQFPVDDRFRYTQTNYWLLNRIIAKLSGMTLQKFILEKQFPDAKPDSVLFIDNNVDRLDVRAKSYLPNKKGELQPATFAAPEYLLGAGGINLTIAEIIHWDQRFDDNSLLNEASKKQMWEPFQFRSEKYPMANGWGIYPSAIRNSYGFTGGGRVGFRKFPHHDLSVVVLTNGYRHRFSPDLIINRLTGIVDAELKIDGPLIDDAMFTAFNCNNLENAISEYHEFKPSVDAASIEQPMNLLGYEFLHRKKTEIAFAVFRLNTQEHRSSWNAWDSLAEYHAAAGNTQAAISNYERSVELNPKNENGKAAIARLKAQQ